MISVLTIGALIISALTIEAAPPERGGVDVQWLALLTTAAHWLDARQGPLQPVGCVFTLSGYSPITPTLAAFPATF